MDIYLMSVCLCVVTVGITSSETVKERILNSVEIDPYSGSPAETVFIDRGDNDSCHLTVSNTSASEFRNILQQHQPNFVHFHFWFNMTNRISTTKEAILPFRWVWTYYSPDGFFPYLMWPVDFPILSFGLLDFKTQPKHTPIWLIINAEGNCSLTLGETNTTQLITYALRDMTQSYLVNIDQKSFFFSYYCFLEEVPGVKDTMAYQFAVYLGFPLDFDAFRCCRTDVPKYTESIMFVHCLSHQVAKMVEVTVIPYIIGLIAFFYFPLVLMGYSEKLVAPGHFQRICQQAHIGDENSHDWVFLTGKSPLTFLGMFAGLCGIASKHPVAVSRIRRFLFILLCPSVVFIKLYVYHKFQNETTMALLDHHRPMGYLSMLGGYEKSKQNFMPIFGGPFVLLAFFYVAGFLFVVLPSSWDFIMHAGSGISPGREHISPMFFSEEMIEEYSGVSVIKRFGYAKTAAVIRGGICMLVNPQFWSAVFRIQLQRFPNAFNWFRQATRSRVLAFLICILFDTVLIILCLVEIFLCIVYYGIPVVCFLITGSKGYIISLFGIFVQGNAETTAWWSHITIIRLLRYIMTAVFSFLFIYFIFSFCTIFTDSFSFVAELLVFSLVSVIVYPSNSFGYLFFGAAMLYYLYKLLKGFGDGYAELLSDAVEISQHMEDDVSLQPQVFNGTIFLPKITEADMTKLQIFDTVINLSTDQRRHIKNATPSHACKTREKNDMVGIPRDLFDILVRKYRPVYIQVAKSVLLLILVLALIGITISIVVIQPQVPFQGISEVMHVVFIIVVGALPELLGVILDRTDHATKKEIKLKRIKSSIVEYWAKRSREYQNVINESTDSI